jgi:DnaK suppressor protein
VFQGYQIRGVSEAMTATLPAGPVDRDEVRGVLRGMALELTTEYEEATAALAELGRGSGIDGDDEVDAGAKTAEREHQRSLVATIRERLTQVQRALERLDAGSYGTCETCHEPITVERLAVHPSATACVACKRADERRG